jgi:hypothetical protein
MRTCKCFLHVSKIPTQCLCVCVYVNYIQMKKLRIWTVHLKQNVDNDTECVGMMLHQTPPCTCPVLLLSCFPSPQVRYCYTIYHNNHRPNPEVKKIGHSFPSLCSYLIRYTPGYLIRYHCQHFVLNAVQIRSFFI